MVGRIAIGEIEDTKGKAPNRAKGGKAGGAARAKRLTRPSLCSRISTSWIGSLMPNVKCLTLRARSTGAFQA